MTYRRLTVKLLLIGFLAVGTQACALAIGGMFAAHQFAQASKRNAYLEYQTNMARVNTEREAKGLAPLPVQPPENWRPPPDPAKTGQDLPDPPRK